MKPEREELVIERTYEPDRPAVTRAVEILLRETPTAAAIARAMLEDDAAP